MKGRPSYVPSASRVFSISPHVNTSTHSPAWNCFFPAKAIDPPILPLGIHQMFRGITTKTAISTQQYRLISGQHCLCTQAGIHCYPSHHCEMVTRISEQ